MKKINLKVRLKNPVFLLQTAGAVLLPVLAYMGLAVEDLTSWKVLGEVVLDALSNPYVVGIVIFSIFNAVNDPTTEGICDSHDALNYDKPKCNCKKKAEK